MTNKDIADLVVQILVAVGTLGVVVVAIWGDWFRDRFAAAQISIELTSPIGSMVPINPLPGVAMAQPLTAFYVHARVVNRRRWVTPKNCRVLLREVHKKGADGKFYPIPLSVPLRYVWSPSEVTGPVVDVSVDHYFDLGRVIDRPFLGAEFAFVPVLYSYSNNFQGTVKKDECVRFGLQVQADNYASDDLVIVEVEWNGSWSHDVEEMRRNLRITMITERSDEPDRPVI